MNLLENFKKPDIDFSLIGLELPEGILKTERDYEELETVEIRTGREDSGQWISIKKNTQLLLEF